MQPETSATSQEHVPAISMSKTRARPRRTGRDSPDGRSADTAFSLIATETSRDAETERRSKYFEKIPKRRSRQAILAIVLLTAGLTPLHRITGSATLI